MGRKPRVRFAPSPTGELHVGNARTALFNWLFARHYGGTFILRIEDTDRERTSEEFEKAILHELKWLSIDWDEGPEHGGDFGPYHQFERLEIYRHYLETLIQRNKVYPCYCTERELDEERSQLVASRQPPRYLGRCRNLTEKEKLRFENEGRTPTFRFKVDEGSVQFEDLIRGSMRFDSKSIGDFIIVRSNGIPAYNFAVVVDDHLMKISHVIRGEDHLSNTALQMLLYDALGFEPPLFAHHSLILGKDRAKLSKRHGSTTVKEFRQKGILPEAFLNYISLLGSSFGGEREVYSVDEIVREFSLDRAGKSGAIFDEGKLKWLNAIHIRSYNTERLTERLMPFMEAAGYDHGSYDKTWLSGAVEAVMGNITTLSEIGEYIDIFFDDRYTLTQDARAVLCDDTAYRTLCLLSRALRDSEDSEQLYEHIVKTLRKETGLKGKKLFMPIRAAVTGKLIGPELDKVFVVLGKESIIRRVERALESVNSDENKNI